MKKIFILFLPLFLLWGEEESSSHVQVSSLEQIEILEEDIFEGQTNFYEEQADISESFSDQAAIHEQVGFQDEVAQRDQDLSQVDLDKVIVNELKGIALIDNPVDMKRNINDLEDVEYVNFNPPAPAAEKIEKQSSLLHWQADYNPIVERTSTDMIYEKGDSLAETNILLRTQDVAPWRLYTGYEYTGNIIGGDSRLLGGINWANVWGLGHHFNAQFVSAPNPDRWWGVGGNYIAPLPWRHTFKAYGTFIKSQTPNLSDPTLINPTNQSGKSWEVGGRYSIPLPAILMYRHVFLVGYDFKRTNNFLEFSQALIFSNFFDISQFVTAYEGTEEDRWGTTLFGVSAYLSPGKMTKYNRDRFYQNERPGADANYAYIRATLDRTTLFPLRFSWILSSLYQWASGKLLPSEQISFGGFATIRGYDESEVISDRGVMIKNEVRTPPVSFFKHGVVRDELQFLVFFDWGYSYDVDRNILNRNTSYLYSVGPGLRYSINPYMTVRFDYGFQLHDIKNRPFVSMDHSRAHLGIIIGFDPRGKMNFDK